MKVTMITSILMLLSSMSLLTQKLMSMGAILLINAILMTFMTSFLISSWFGFILFLIYITGLLVLFGYFLALSPNYYHTSKKCFKSYVIILMTVMGAVLTYNLTWTSQTNMSFEFDVISLISSKNMMFYWLMTIILLLALLIVVSLTFKSPSPLRKYLN